MDEHPDELLRGVLAKLEALEGEVSALRLRLEGIEGGMGMQPDKGAGVDREQNGLAINVEEMPVETGTGFQPATDLTGELEPVVHGQDAGDVWQGLPAPEQDSSRVHGQDAPATVRPPKMPSIAPPPMPMEGAGVRPVGRGSDGSKHAVQGQDAPATPEIQGPGAAATSGDSWEMRIAGTWLPRIGVLFLALVLILVARQHVHGPLGKVVGCYVLSAVLIVAGLWQERKYPRWALPVLAGGLAFSYFTTYAMGFVEPMRLLDGLGMKLGALAVNLVAVFGFAQWRRSEIIAGMALVLGYLTTGVTGSDAAALGSALALSVMALLFLWRNRWFVSTAVAAAASYMAYLYVWRAVPEAVERTEYGVFWFHFAFLTMLFVVYAAAGVIGRGAALAEEDEASAAGERTVSAWGRRVVLAMLTQLNVAAYIGAMVAVLKVTGIYWQQAWIYFLPMAAACAGLAALFGGLRAVQSIYATAAVVCFTLGVMALVSGLWLPVILAVQAVAMLVAARRRGSELWGGLSVVVLMYGWAYLMSGGAVDVLELSGAGDVAFPWWVFAVVAAMGLVYAGVWERLAATRLSGVMQAVPYAVAAGAALIWRSTMDMFGLAEGVLIIGAAVPAVTVAMLFARVASPVVFVALTAVLGLLTLGILRGPGEAWDPELPMILLAAAGLGAGWLAEKIGCGDPMSSRILWRVVYVWAQVVFIVAFVWLDLDWVPLPAFSAMFIVCTALGWLTRSAALAKSGYIALLLLPLAAENGEYSIWVTTACVIGLSAAAYPLALPQWSSRTGDSVPEINRWGQAAVMFITGLVFVIGFMGQTWNVAFVCAAWALICAVYAAVGLFVPVVFTMLLFAGFTALAILGNLTEILGGGGELPLASWSIAAVFLLVAAERTLCWARNITLPWAASEDRWLKINHMKFITRAFAVATLVLMIISLRIMPDLRVFYFTGAMVAAAFLWIVFGFWFNESAYRKSGFALLCIGIVKGLVWDVLSLKNTVYRQVSWTILGLLALAASFLYNKFRGRMGPNGTD